MPTTLVWFRTDLRTDDHPALHAAVAEATASGLARSPAGVVGLYVLNPGHWRRCDIGPNKVAFLLRTLRALSARLARLNIPLLIRSAAATSHEPALVASVARTLQAASVHACIEYEPWEQARDDAARAALRDQAIPLNLYHDQCVIEPGAVRTKDDRAFSVFTPFKRAWIAALHARGGVRISPEPKRLSSMPCPPDPVPESVPGFEARVDAALWPAGHEEGVRRLEAFIARGARAYASARNSLDVDGTSALSPYLACGAVSARRCLLAAAEANGGALDTGDIGLTTWISELIWREFCRHVLVAFPRVGKGRAFQPAADRLAWRRAPAELEAWRQGLTGFPIVDAAMRCLLQTGWMHNRARMIVAMFLTKDLLIDWREGERWFMHHLVDGDFASNNGGWQWSASTGTDAAPYFRVFNPVSQSRTCDPQGTFIRRWVPELRSVEGDAVHEPWELGELAFSRLGYPERIVDHAMARARVGEAFAAIKRA